MYCCRLFDRSAWDRSELRFHHCRNHPPNRGALLTLRRDWFHRPDQINRPILESACTCGQKRPAVQIAYFHCPVYNNIDTRELPKQTQSVAEGCVCESPVEEDAITMWSFKYFTPDRSWARVACLYAAWRCQCTDDGVIWMPAPSPCCANREGAQMVLPWKPVNTLLWGCAGRQRNK